MSCVLGITGNKLNLTKEQVEELGLDFDECRKGSALLITEGEHDGIWKIYHSDAYHIYLSKYTDIGGHKV
jgi:hypothetical protein